MALEDKLFKEFSSPDDYLLDPMTIKKEKRRALDILNKDKLQPNLITETGTNTY